MGLFSWLFGNERKGPQYGRWGPGWVIDHPDIRDACFSSAFAAGTYEHRADLRPHMPPIVSQGPLGTCVPCVLVAMISYLVNKSIAEEKSRGHVIPLDEVLPGPTTKPGDLNYVLDDEGGLHWFRRTATRSTVSSTDCPTFSRLFLYYEGRRREGRADEDVGMKMRTGLKVLNKTGVCLESYWPYHARRYAWKPSREAYENADKYRIKKYWRLDDLDDVRKSLYDGYPVTVGLTLYWDSWMESKKDGFLRVPTLKDKPVGGHAMLIVGYDDEKSHLICRNSMGATWGDDGHVMMPMAYVNDGIVRDMWTIRA